MMVAVPLTPATTRAKQTRCVVCDKPTSLAASFHKDDQEYSLCNSIHCRRIMEQKHFMSSAMFAWYLESQRKNLREISTKAAKISAYREELTRVHSRQHEQICRAALRDRPELNENTTRLVVIPSGLSEPVPLSAGRVDRYIAHLKDVIHRAVGPEEFIDNQNETTANSVAQAISDKVCGMCKGGCCAGGREHAYITANTIRRCMNDHPELSQEDVLLLYTSHIAQDSIARACINQTVKGCALPRELRSETCNRYYCDSLKSYRKVHTEGAKLDAVVVVQHANTNWTWHDPDTCSDIVDAALVSESEIRHIEHTVSGDEPRQSISTT